jgi:sarcosine oxidase subunit gamma
MTGPADQPRRSFLYRKLMAAGARFEAFGDTAVAVDYGDPEAEREAAKRMGLADLSPLPRTGFKGAGTPDWLAKQEVEIGRASCRERV